MHFLSPLLLTLLSTLAAARSNCTGNPSVAGYCTVETWTDQTTDSAPLIDGSSGCEDACYTVATDSSDWFANLTGAAAGEKRPLIGYACGLSIGRGAGEGDPLTFSIASQDILDIYSGTIERFAKDGRVAATGTMKCEGKEVAWWIG